MAATDELLQLMLEQNAEYAIMIADPNGMIIGWLAGAERVFGYSAAEIIGQPLSILFTPEDRERQTNTHEMTVARADGHAEDDRWQVRKDGTRIWATGVLIALRDSSGTIVGFCKMLRDRTDLRAQIEALANAIERQKVFFGTLAHELRNPLAPLANAVHLIRLTPGSEAAAQPLLTIERQIEFFRRLIDDLLDVTRVGTGKFRLQMSKVHLEDVLNRAAEACRPLAEKHGHQFRVLLLPTPTVLEADPDRLEQVVVNLLTNAIKYTPDGGVVWLKATIEGTEAVFRVEDSGVGIDPEMLPRIFDLFTQEASSLDRSQGGLGLGLPLVRELVTIHGGTVQVRSEGRGKGSEFTVRLPIARSSGGS